MITVQSPATGNHLPRPKPGRRPLQPLKSTSNSNNNYQKPDLKIDCIEISQSVNKENPNQNEKRNQNRSSIKPISSVDVAAAAAAPVRIEQFEVSLADELSAMREKMERLKSDREKTEKMLKEREVMMEMKMKEIEQRGEIQKVLEIEVDRLFRLKELRSLCNRILPIRSLREKEQEKIKPDKSQEVKEEETEEEMPKIPCE